MQKNEEPTNGKTCRTDEHRRRQESVRKDQRPADDFVELDELRVSFWGISSESVQNFYDN